MDLLAVEKRLVRERVPDLVMAGDVGGGEHREDARNAERGLHVDLYAGVGLGAADDLDHGRPLRYVVGREPGPAEGLFEGVRPHDAVPHDEVVVPPQQVLKDLIVLHRGAVP